MRMCDRCGGKPAREKLVPSLPIDANGVGVGAYFPLDLCASCTEEMILLWEHLYKQLKAFCGADWSARAEGR